MSLTATYELFPGQDEVISSLNWRQDEMDDKLGQLHDYHTAFDEVLMRDVRPSDLVVYGPPDAVASVNYRATDGELMVSLDKTRDDRISYKQERLLAHQAERAGLWVPGIGVEKRRIARITKLVGEVFATTVKVSSVTAPEDAKGEDKTPPVEYLLFDRAGFAPVSVDETLARADWMATWNYGARHVREYIDTYPSVIEGEDEEAEPLISERAWAMSLDLTYAQGQAEPTFGEYAAEAQGALDRWFEKLDERLTIAGTAQQIIRGGKRVRPN
jgi:hypothetical protein